MFYFWLLLLWNIIVFKVSLVSACRGSDSSLKLLGGKYEFIDLTLPLGNATFFPDTPNKFKRFEDTTMTVSISGTRIEAPKHHELHVSDLPPEKLIVQLIIIDVSGKVKDSNYVLYMKDINSKLGSEILRHMSWWPSLVIFKFGWSHYYYHDHKKYFGHDESTNSSHLPALSNEVAEWLTTCEYFKKIVGIGTDLPSLDAGGSNASDSARQSLTKAGLYIVEGLSFNYSLPNYQCTAVVAPAKITESIAPSNVIAICPKHHNDSTERHVREMRKHRTHKREIEHKHEMSAEHEKHKHGMEHKMSEYHKKENEHGMSKHHKYVHGMEHEISEHHKKEHEHGMCGHHKNEHGMEHEISEHHKKEHEHGMSKHHKHEHGMEHEISEHHKKEHGHGMSKHHKHEHGMEHEISEHHKKEHEHGMSKHHKHVHGMEHEISEHHKKEHEHGMSKHHKHEHGMSEHHSHEHVNSTETNNQLNVTQGNNNANEKPSKTGETENKQPNLKPQQIVGGIKDKIKEFVKTSK